MLKPFIVALAASLILAASAQAADKLGPGDVAPDEVGRILGGGAVKLSDYAGKAIVLSYWATWCPYCVKELPILNNMQRLVGKQRMAVIAVDIEDRDTFRAVRRAFDGKLDFTLAYDPYKTGQKNYGVTAYPHMVIIGRDGRIVKVYRGYGEGALSAIAEDLNKALAAPMPEAKPVGANSGQ